MEIIRLKHLLLGSRFQFFALFFFMFNFILPQIPNVKSNIPLPCEALLSYGLRAADVINRSSLPHVKNTSGSGCWGIRTSFQP